VPRTECERWLCRSDLRSSTVPSWPTTSRRRHADRPSTLVDPETSLATVCFTASRTRDSLERQLAGIDISHRNKQHNVIGRTRRAWRLSRQPKFESFIGLLEPSAIVSVDAIELRIPSKAPV
jgi:hypothetical protein